METKPKRRVSFPVVVYYTQETGEISLERPTGYGFQVKVSRDPESSIGHPQLFCALSSALHDQTDGFSETPSIYN